MTPVLTDLFVYLLQASMGLGVFIGLYRLLLAKLTFFAWNRCYLMGTALIGLLIPFIRFDSFTVTPYSPRKYLSLLHNGKRGWYKPLRPFRFLPQPCLPGCCLRRG
jgi:hypothetical protein